MGSGLPFGNYLSVLMATSVLSGVDPQWNLVSDTVTVAPLANFASQVLARTLLGTVLRLLMVRWIGEGLSTDIFSILLSQVFPSSLLLAAILLSGYAVIGFRFIYDLLVTGNGLVWMYYRSRGSAPFPLIMAFACNLMSNSGMNRITLSTAIILLFIISSYFL